MKSSPDPPPAPNPTESTQAQTASNIQTAIANARLNRINQQTPWGSIDYTQGPADASGVPSYSSQINLSPTQQALLEQQQGQQAQRGNLSSSLLNQASGSMSQPLNLQNLHPVYDRYAPGGQATSAVSRQPPPQAAPQAAPQQQMPGRDQMLAMLMQWLQSQGQGQGPSQGPPTNPMARALNSGGSAPVTSPTTGANPQTGGGGFLPADLVNQIHDNPFGDWSRFKGSLGNVNNPHPQDIWGQYDEGGNAPQQALDPNVWGNDGRLRPEIQARLMRNDQGQFDPNGTQWAPFSGQGVLDQNKVQFDPEFGLITPGDNNRNPPSGGFTDILPLLLMAPAAAGAIGAVGAGAAGGGAGLAGAEAGGLTLGAGSGATAGAGAGFAAEGALGGAATAGATAAGTGAANYAPVTNLSTQAAQPSLGSTLFNNWSSGRGLLGMNRAGSSAGPLLAQLLRAMQGGKAK